MKDYAPGIKSSDLTLADVPTTAGAAAKPAPPRAEIAAVEATLAPPIAPIAIVAPIAPKPSPVAAEPAPALAPDPAPAAPTTSRPFVGNDEFLTEAEREYAAGRVDKPLWARALSLAGGDEAAAVPAYLRARATAIRVAKRAKRRERSLRRVHGGPKTGMVEEAQTATATSEPASPRLRIPRIDRKHVIWAGGVAGIVLAASALLIAQSNDDAAPQKGAAIAVARASAPSKLLAGATAPSKSTGAAKSAEVPTEDFAGKVQGFKDAGNWNVLVLYAVEWTRKQPANAEAWRALSHGYIKLRQLAEALDTATKAVELGPGDFLNWQNLGQVNVALQRNAEAHAAFQQAATLNEKDVVSLVQAGLLDAQFGRVADARSAFDKALAVNPRDVDALCGATSVARKEGRLNDAEAATLQLKAIDGQCRGANTVESVRVVISSTPKTKGVLSNGR